MSGLQDLLLAKAGSKARSAYRERYGSDPDRAPGAGGSVRTSRAPRIPEDPLAEVRFASDEARRAAEEKGLVWSDFATDPGGASGSGGWTVADVRRIAADLEEDDGREG